MFHQLSFLALIGLMTVALPAQAGKPIGKLMRDSCSDKTLGISKKSQRVGRLMLELEKMLQKEITQNDSSGTLKAEIERAQTILQVEEQQVLSVKSACVRNVLEKAGAGDEAVGELWALVFELRDEIQKSPTDSNRPKCYGRAALMRVIEDLLVEHSKGPNVSLKKAADQVVAGLQKNLKETERSLAQE